MTSDIIEESLLNFGQLLGLLDSQRSIRWVWFKSPELEILGGDASHPGLPGRRQYLGPLIRGLTGINSDAPSNDSFANYSWAPLNSGDIKVGFFWSNYTPVTPELEFGFGSKADFQAGKMHFAVLAKLFKMQAGKMPSLTKDAMFIGSIPSPDFLESIELQGETTPPTVELDITDKTGGPSALRALKFSSDTLSAPTNEIFAWDCARFALFVLEAWIHDKAKASGTVDNVFTRADGHLFPMFGEPAQPHINPFPLFGGQPNMGQSANFDPWADSVLNLSDGAAGALAFLWHTRALLTGNENGDFLKGSFFLPLVNGALGGAVPTDPTKFTGVYDPRNRTVAGVWVGITVTGAVYTLVLDIISGTQPGTDKNYLRIQLAQLSGSPPKLTRPQPQPPNATTPLDNFLSQWTPGESGLTVGKLGGSWAVSFVATLDGTGFAFLDGTYRFDAILESPVRFQVAFPDLPLTLALPPEKNPAPSTLKAMIIAMVQWVISAIPPDDLLGDSSRKIKAIAKELGVFLAAELTTPGSGKIGNLLVSIGKALSDGSSVEINHPPFDLTFSLREGTTSQDSFCHLVSGVSYGPLAPEQIPNFPISIGKLSATVDLAVDHPTNPLWKFTLGMNDVRFGDGAGGTGLEASLIPNLKQAPGFTIQYDWTSDKGPLFTGGGKIPVQLTLGPLSLSQLVVEVNSSGLTIGINLTFQLSVITISAYELALKLDHYNSNDLSPSLQGLGLSFEGAGIKLSGLFLNNNHDYIGGVAVSIEDLFALTAIGGYTQLVNGKASMFIFASLAAPLGGPPMFFLTGIAGGFGYNRTLPPMTLMSKHPFIKIMNNEISISTDPKQGMADLSALDDPETGFAPKDGEYWIAAGIQFVSFGFINGKVIVKVSFGHDFSFDLLGIASFGIANIAYFEIDILVTVDQEKFLLIAGVSKNSYLIHPDILSLSGDFCLGVWHSGEHAGDFLLSIGGYHPYFQKPEYYPSLNRVSCKAAVYDVIHLDVECFFACTPQAIMAGASLSLSARFDGVGAGLDVYLDVFIRWHPFYIRGTMGVTVWFEFLGRHEIGVDLEIYAPKLGGKATIHLFIVSFDINFGDPLETPPLPPIADFITKRLGVPATAWNSLGKGAQLPLFNSDQAAGLIRVLFTFGRTSADKADGTKHQEGSDPNDPVQVAPEFSFVVRTHLPFRESDADLNSSPKTTTDANPQPIAGIVHLPLCEDPGPMLSTLTVQLRNVTKSLTENVYVPVPSQDITRSADFFPCATFGDRPLPQAQADQGSARQAVSTIDTPTTIPLTDSLCLNLQAQPVPPAQPFMLGPEEELSARNESYPLAFGWPPAIKPTYILSKPALRFSANLSLQAKAAQLKPAPLVDRRQLAMQTMKSARHRATKITMMTAPFSRDLRAAPTQTTSVAAPPGDATAMAPPTSPVRRAELALVSLRILAPHTPAPTARISVRRPIVLKIVQPTHSVLAPFAPAALAAAAPVPGIPASQPTISAVQVGAGQAVQLEIIGGASSPQGSLTFAGSQAVRAVFLSAFGQALADQYLAGNQETALPPNTCRILLVGEGGLTGAPASLGTVGVEAATSLFAISRTEFAGHGCVVQSRTPILKNFDPGDTLSGSDVLPSGASFSFLFPTPSKPSALLIAVAPTVANPSPAPTQVRWRALNANLSDFNTVVTPDRAAFVMNVQGGGAWHLDVNLGPDWRLASVVVCDLTGAEVLTTLSAQTNWHFVDDRFVEPTSPISTTVTLEIANG